jgi:hypothetical protein
VVEAPVSSRRRRTLAVAGALLAVGVLAGMLLSGRTPGTKRYVRFEPGGLMAEAPDRISRVELTAAGQRFALVRDTPGAWRAEPAPSAPLSGALVTHVETGIHFMHVAPPTRVIERDEYERTRLSEFGLDPPRYAVWLFAPGRAVLKTAFGSPNPMQISQYVRVEGREELYLLPRFIGREWEQVIENLVRPPAQR